MNFRSSPIEDLNPEILAEILPDLKEIYVLIDLLEKTEPFIWKSVHYNPADDAYKRLRSQLSFLKILESSNRELVSKISSLVSSSKKSPRHVVWFEDHDQNVLMMMTIVAVVGKYNFHFAITKSFTTFVSYILEGKEFPTRISVDLHKKALELTQATHIIAPPLPKMREILCKNFCWEDVPKVNNKNDYSKIFTEEEIKLVPKFFGVNYTTTIFWE